VRAGAGGAGRWQGFDGIASAATALTVWSALTLASCTPPPGAPRERVVVPPRATFAQVTDSLMAHRVITLRPWFKLLARVRQVDRDVHAGIYEFPQGSSAWQVLSTLAAGKVLQVRFTAPEGLTVLELADLAEERLHIPAESLTIAASDLNAARDLGLGGNSMEGFLLPETYQLREGISARELVRVMVEEFLRQWPPAWNARLDSLHLTRADILALASIVEGEARHDADRPIIAGVYMNRLRRGMPLQADPTVQYALQLRTGERKPRLFFKDYGFPSPYNTYLHQGLPPGPVNSPGLRSIEAALYPADVPYLYFVAGLDGRHVFSRTIREHNAAVAKIQAEQRALRRARRQRDPAPVP
jgi:UPF0755 protein